MARGRREAARLEEASRCEWQTLPTVGSLRFAAFSGCGWIASASGHTVPVVGFVGRSGISRELKTISTSREHSFSWELSSPAELHDVHSYPCLLTKACLLRAPSVVTSTQASMLHDEGGAIRPHNSELRAHRQLEHPSSKNRNNTGSPALTSAHPIKILTSLLRLKTSESSLSNKPEDNHRIHKMPDFKPKNPVQLAPPKDDPISLEELAKADGKTIVLQLERQ